MGGFKGVGGVSGRWEGLEAMGGAFELGGRGLRRGRSLWVGDPSLYRPCGRSLTGSGWGGAVPPPGRGRGVSSGGPAPSQVLTAAGTSPKIDVFTNLGYRAFSLCFA